jgi:hypothetical protein
LPLSELFSPSATFTATRYNAALIPLFILPSRAVSSVCKSLYHHVVLFVL